MCVLRLDCLVWVLRVDRCCCDVVGLCFELVLGFCLRVSVLSVSCVVGNMFSLMFYRI